MFKTQFVLTIVILVGIFWYYSFMYHAGVPVEFLAGGLLGTALLGDMAYPPVPLAVLLSPGLFLL